MNVMATPYEVGGRARQKQRTRNALVDAARQIVAGGSTPTVEGAAAAASVSRTTAYRYFPSQRALLAAAHPEMEADSLLPADPPADAAARLDIVVQAFIGLIIDTETQQRTMLRLSLEAAPDEGAELPLRKGRAIGWIEEALEPLRADIGSEELHRLVLAIRSAIGIEALAWLTDIAGLDRSDAAELMRWSAHALYRAVADDGTTTTADPHT